MPNDFDKEHLKRLLYYEKQILKIYEEAVARAALLGNGVSGFDPKKLFVFSQYPSIKNRMDKLAEWLYGQVHGVIINGIDAEWTLSNNKNNELARLVLGENLVNIPKSIERKYFSNNFAAKEAFIKRKNSGLNISDRVWKYTNQFKSEIELGLDLGLRNGLSVSEISSDLKKYLQNPDMLFRRVRDEHGNLKLSKRAKAFHPGRGVYRSSYKNARRLAATETNIAYRTADYERWQEFDFVVGIEIKLSNNHTINGKTFKDICDELKGKYPKDFKFTGWHPLCRCHAITILKDWDEIQRDNERILAGKAPLTRSRNKVKTTPANYKEWLKENKERVTKAKSKPNFIKDNETTTKKPVSKSGSKSKTAKYIEDVKEIDLNQVKKIISLYATENENLFLGGLNGVSIIKNMKAFMSNTRVYSGYKYNISHGNKITILNSTAYLRGGGAFNPAQDLKDALIAIKNKTPLTFNQEYALESLWHEIRHAGAKGWEAIYKKTENRVVSMEVINQFCARHSYDEFISSLGGKAINKKDIIEKGYGYRGFLSNFRKVLEHYEINESKTYAFFKDIIQEKPYEEIQSILLEYLQKNKVKNASEIVRCLSSSEEYFDTLLKNG